VAYSSETPQISIGTANATDALSCWLASPDGICISCTRNTPPTSPHKSLSKNGLQRFRARELRLQPFLRLIML
jgi:hypothetical protein